MKRIQYLLAILLTFILLLGIFPSAAAYTPAHHVIRVGINNHRSWQPTPSVHLTNESGLRLGTYNAAREFVPSANTTHNSLTIDGSGSSLTVRDSGGTLVHSGQTVTIAPVNRNIPSTYTLPDVRFADHVRRSFSFHGGFRFHADSGSLTVVNYVDLEDYLKGVIPYEVFPSWPMDALKAQAVTARTYAVANFGRFGSHGFDVTNTVVSQVYKGMHGTTERTNQAVRETAGQFVLHNGHPIDAVYHAAHGGATEDAVNVWGFSIPYLRGLRAPHEQLPANIQWSRTLTPSEFRAHMQARDPDFHLPDIADVIPTYTPLGNMFSVTFVASNGETRSYHRDRARTIVNAGLHPLFNSQRFTIERNLPAHMTATSAISANKSESLYPYHSALELTGMADAGTLPTHIASEAAINAMATGTPTFTVTNYGFGHNVGMSQYGAMSLAQLGYTYGEIIRFYYHDVEITNYTPARPPAPGPPATTPPTISRFEDIAPGAWYFDVVEHVSRNGLMRGTSDTRFSPLDTTTRGMFVTILGRMAGISEHDFWPSGTYRDVASDRFYAPYVEWASRQGIAKGMGDGTFRPDQPVTRQEMAVFLHRYANAMGITLAQDANLPAFRDLHTVAHWAKDAVIALQQAGIIQGIGGGFFEPRANSNRAGVASMITNFHQRYGADHLNKAPEPDIVF